MLRNRLLPVMAAALLSVSGAAQACSVVPGYQVPTALELTARADAIILARVGEHIPGTESYDLGRVVLEPETLIAGDTLPTGLTVSGYHSNEGWQARPSDPNDLRNANPDAFAGGCSRYVFDRGMLLLLFVTRQADGSWDIIDSAFARTLEDVPNADALWVRAVRYYATVARLPRSERNALMRAEQRRLMATGDPQDALLAADIRRQIKGRRTQNFD